MLDSNRQRPWSEAEIARTISTPGNVPASLKRLRIAGLIHRWNDLATASHPAMRFHEITQSPKDSASKRERHWDKAVLESLLVRDSDDQGPLSEQDLHYAFGAKKKKTAVLVELAPPLNIEKVETPWRRQVKAARQTLAQEARAWRPQ